MRATDLEAPGARAVRRRRGRPALVAATAALALVGAGCAAPADEAPADIRVLSTQSGDYRGIVLDQPYTLPDLTFTDTDGEPFNLAEDTTGPVTLVFFGYASCPDVCGIVLANIAAALRGLPEAQRRKVEVVFITTDPARDTPEVIRDYLDRFDPGFTGLTAPMPTIEEAALALGVPLTGMERLPSGGYEVGHGAQVVGFDQNREGRYMWPEDTPVADLRHDLDLLTRGG